MQNYERGVRQNCGIEEVVSGQYSVVSRVFSGDPQGSTFELGNVDFGLRNGERITGHGSRITRKLSGRTKPFRRKLNAAREKSRALPQSKDDGHRRACRHCGHFHRRGECGTLDTWRDSARRPNRPKPDHAQWVIRNSNNLVLFPPWASCWRAMRCARGWRRTVRQ